MNESRGYGFRTDLSHKSNMPIMTERHDSLKPPREFKPGTGYVFQ
jgi:hypothetical protein